MENQPIEDVEGEVKIEQDSIVVMHPKVIGDFCDSLKRLFENKPNDDNIEETLWEYRHVIVAWLLEEAEERGYSNGANDASTAIETVEHDINDLD